MAIQVIAFSDELRTLIAQLDLQVETQQITAEEYAKQKAAAIGAEAYALDLDAGWRTDPAPPERHHPTGKTSVFWKLVVPRSDLAAS